jgi:hypothetical protein
MGNLDLTTLNGINSVGRSGLYPIRVGEGNENVAWLGKDGSAISLPWQQALALEGRCFSITVGALVTGIASGAGTIPELAEPEFVIGVPAGTVMMPLRVACQCFVADAIADHSHEEIIVGIDRGKTYDGTGTCTAEVAYNLRTDNPRSTMCTCVSAVTADITSIPVMLTELARTAIFVEQTTAVGTVPIEVSLLYQPVVAPFIVGPAMLVGMWGGTSALTGYAQVYWAEWTKTELGL